MSPAELKALIRTIPDFPAKGIQFRDITTLLTNGPGLVATIDHCVKLAEKAEPEAVAGIEARGFIFGAAMAARMGIGFIPLRKAGKLPVETLTVDYELEYGAEQLELDPTAVSDKERILLVDDLLATGGTALAGAHLLRKAGAVVEHAVFVVDLPDLGGGDALREAGIKPHCLFDFPGH